MSTTDPVADFLTRIRNGLTADFDDVEIPASRLKIELARILREQGYIDGYEVESARVGEVIRVRLKYTEDRRSVITGLERVSRPGRRTYVNAGEIPKVLGGMGTAIVSTSRGVMTGHDARRARGAGVARAHGRGIRLRRRSRRARKAADRPRRAPRAARPHPQPHRQH